MSYDGIEDKPEYIDSIEELIDLNSQKVVQAIHSANEERQTPKFDTSYVYGRPSIYIPAPIPKGLDENGNKTYA